MDTLQGCATLKGPASDCLCAGWERDALQRCTIGKTVAPDIVNTGRDVKGCLHLPCRIVDQLGLGFVIEHTVCGSKMHIAGIYIEGCQGRAVDKCLEGSAMFFSAVHLEKA